MSAASSSAARPALAAATALAVPILCLGVDLALRGSHLPREGFATYATGALLSVLVWGFGMEAARHPRRAVRVAALAFLGFLAAFGIGLQAVVRAFTHAYLGRRALLLALGIPSVLQSSYIEHAAPRIAAACLVPAVIVVILARLRKRWLGSAEPRAGLKAGAAAIAVIVTLFAPFTVQGLQPLPPDVLWIHGAGGPLLYALGLAQRPKTLPVGRREPLPAVTPAPVDAPPIVLILGESVRRDAVCLSRAPGCDKSPRVDAAAPDRIGYPRAYTTASCTELASASLWTGLAIDASPDALASAPLLWDFAGARGYRTAYFTSQNLLFQQSDLFLRTSRIDRLREARHRVLDARIDDGSPDEDTTEEALELVESPGAPAFVVVHHANTHAPYRQTPGFTPHPDESARARYENSLVREDDLVGDLVARLRRGARGKNAIVIYTSDHGEAFGEHGASYHSFDLYGEQSDIPLWIDIPKGLLPEAVMSRLAREAPERVVTLPDLSATLLDLAGALDAPALRDRVAALSGASLLREAPAGRAALMWNCPPTRECATDSFGVLRFPLKLHWVGHDQRYACHDLAADPLEKTPLPVARCADLFPLADRAFGTRAGHP
jgi:hypothetical protein